jgi:hypothetical protein
VNGGRKNGLGQGCAVIACTVGCVCKFGVCVSLGMRACVRACVLAWVCVSLGVWVGVGGGETNPFESITCQSCSPAFSMNMLSSAHTTFGCRGLLHRRGRADYAR